MTASLSDREGDFSDSDSEPDISTEPTLSYISLEEILANIGLDTSESIISFPNDTIETLFVSGVNTETLAQYGITDMSGTLITSFEDGMRVDIVDIAAFNAAKETIISSIQGNIIKNQLAEIITTNISNLSEIGLQSIDITYYEQEVALHVPDITAIPTELSGIVIQADETGQGAYLTIIDSLLAQDAIVEIQNFADRKIAASVAVAPATVTAPWEVGVDEIAAGMTFPISPELVSDPAEIEAAVVNLKIATAIQSISSAFTPDRLALITGLDTELAVQG